jgi:hypothetical protein
VHADEVAEELSAHEGALRKLPLPYSLALRLRDAGVAPEVVSEYVGVDEDALDGVYRIAEAKLRSAREATGCVTTSMSGSCCGESSDSLAPKRKES